MTQKSDDAKLPFYKRLTDEQRQYLEDEPVKNEPTCGLESLLADRPTIIFHAMRDPDACKHEWGGWREIDNGRSGETVCKLCGIGAMAHSLRTGP